MRSGTAWCGVVVFALVLASSLAQAESTSNVSSVNLLSGANRSVTDQVVDGQPTSRTPNASNATVAGFDLSLGVLTGVSGTLSVAPAPVRRLAVTGSEGSATISASLLSLPGISATGTLINASTSGSPSSDWRSIAFSASGDLNPYVTSSLTASVSTVLSANRNGATATGTVATIINANNLNTASSLSGSLEVRYDYLQHANASWSALSNSDSKTIRDVTQTVTVLSVHALPGSLGAPETTGLDLLNVTCAPAPACNIFDLDFDNFATLSAGGRFEGSVRVKPGADTSFSRRAVYSFSFADDADVGATSSHMTNPMTLVVFSAVTSPIPEPSAYVLALLGIGTIGAMVGRRRGVRGDASPT